MKNEDHSSAPGWPGIPARWTSSAKDGIGGAISTSNNVAFTLSHGIINEIYFPGIDTPSTRDMGLIVTDGLSFFSEEKRNSHTFTKEIEYGIPAFEISNVCSEKKYKITKRIVTDSYRNTIIQRIRFETDAPEPFKVFALLAPHLNNAGNNNNAWTGTYKGHSILYAENEGIVLAMVCSRPWLKKSVGFVGTSDGWQDLYKHKEMQWQYSEAKNGNVALTAELNFGASNEVEIVIGFGFSAEEAAYQAVASLMVGYEQIAKTYMQDWRLWQEQLQPVHSDRLQIGGLFRSSAAVLHMHQSKNYPGAMVASLSIPWGEAAGDENDSGYHLVWPRDLVESAGGLLAIHAKQDVRNVLNYLITTQEDDGHWPQNMWLHGKEHWSGIQLDETALPILFVDLCRKHGVIDKSEISKYWPAVKKAAIYLLRKGIVTEQDRWEEQQAISVFTMSTMISGLLAAADLSQAMEEHDMASFCRDTADAWNGSLDYWLYITGTSLAREAEVEGYYLQLNPGTSSAAGLADSKIQIKNRPVGSSEMEVRNLVSVDALALVRFGLRSAKDPRMLNTIKIIDQQLKVDTPTGPCWYRYKNDGYGEQHSGEAYDHTGIGRLWPLLTGERAHYEIAAGNLSTARKLLKAMESFSNNGLFPEQIWDQEDIPEKELFFGKHTHSAMPLVWAHAEHLKLVCSLKEGSIFDLPRHAYDRYVVNQKATNRVIWRIELPVHAALRDQIMRIELHSLAKIRWTMDHWESYQEEECLDSGFGLFYLDLPPLHNDLIFTFYYSSEKRWDGLNYQVSIAH